MSENLKLNSEIGPRKYAEYAKALIMAREPFLVIGAPGCGKTDITREAAAECGYDFIQEFPPTKDPTDYLGIGHAYTVDGEVRADFIPCGTLRRIKNAKNPTLVLLDELGKATRATQNAIAQMMLSRTIDGEPISDMVSFCAATNRRSDGAGEMGIPSHFVDRFTTILKLRQSIVDWSQWAIQKGPDGKPRVPIELIAFCRFKPKDTVEFPFDPNASKDMRKIPTARTVEAVGRLYKAGITDFDILAGAAGEGFAAAFLAFLDVCKKLPPPEAIVNDPMGVPVPQESDIRFALSMMLSSYATMNNFDAIIQFLGRLPKDCASAAISLATARNSALFHCPAYMEWSIANADSLLA